MKAAFLALTFLIFGPAYAKSPVVGPALVFSWPRIVREAAMTQSELEIELESRLRSEGYDGGVTVRAIGSDGRWSARLNIEDGPPWTFKRRLIELVAELSRDNFIDYSD